MTLFINRCFATVTPKSAENGDFDDTGFVYQDVEFTFRELIRELREFTSLSSSHSTGSIGDWACTGFSTSDYRTGEEREETLHFSRENPERFHKYWAKALRAADLIR
jgi:hypothetical protein